VLALRIVTDAELQNVRMVWKARSLFFVVVAACIIVVALVFIGVRAFFVSHALPEEATHSELINVVLSGLTISVAVLALVVAGIAIWGYHAIQDQSRKIAVKSARSSALKVLRGEDMIDLLRKEARVAIEDEFSKWKESQALANSQPAQQSAKIEAESGEKVAKRRPRREVNPQ
jgi:hypothetical protein